MSAFASLEGFFFGGGGSSGEQCGSLTTTKTWSRNRDGSLNSCHRGRILAIRGRQVVGHLTEAHSWFFFFSDPPTASETKATWICGHCQSLCVCFKNLVLWRWGKAIEFTRMRRLSGEREGQNYVNRWLWLSWGGGVLTYNSQEWLSLEAIQSWAPDIKLVKDWNAPELPGVLGVGWGKCRVCLCHMRITENGAGGVSLKPWKIFNSWLGFAVTFAKILSLSFSTSVLNGIFECLFFPSDQDSIILWSSGWSVSSGLTGFFLINLCTLRWGHGPLWN